MMNESWEQLVVLYRYCCARPRLLWPKTVSAVSCPRNTRCFRPSTSTQARIEFHPLVGPTRAASPAACPQNYSQPIRFPSFCFSVICSSFEPQRWSKNACVMLVYDIILSKYYLLGKGRPVCQNNFWSNGFIFKQTCRCTGYNCKYVLSVWGRRGRTRARWVVIRQRPQFKTLR